MPEQKTLPIPEGATVLSPIERQWFIRQKAIADEHQRECNKQWALIRSVIQIIGDRGTGELGGDYELSGDFGFVRKGGE